MAIKTTAEISAALAEPNNQRDRDRTNTSRHQVRHPGFGYPVLAMLKNPTMNWE
jgi:hypothetical protein